MDIRRLEIFLKLFETRSFSKTAAVLGLSQPSISASLKTLEENLGQKLFERTPRTVKALPAAFLLLPYARNVVETVGRMTWELNQPTALQSHRLFIGASSVSAEVLLPPALIELRRLYPAVDIRIAMAGSQAVIRQVADGELDMGIVGSRPYSSEIVTIPVCQDDLVLAASGDLAERCGPPPQCMEDLIRWPLISREEDSGTRAAFIAALGGNPALASAFNVRFEVEGFHAGLALARCSLGAMIVSSLLTRTGLLGGLTVMPLTFLTASRQFYLIRRKSADSGPALLALVSILQREGAKCVTILN